MKLTVIVVAVIMIILIFIDQTCKFFSGVFIYANVVSCRALCLSERGFSLYFVSNTIENSSVGSPIAHIDQIPNILLLL